MMSTIQRVGCSTKKIIDDELFVAASIANAEFMASRNDNFLPWDGWRLLWLHKYRLTIGSSPHLPGRVVPVCGTRDRS